MARSFQQDLTPEYGAARTMESDRYFDLLWENLTRSVKERGPLYQAELKRIPKEVYLKHVYSPLLPGGYIVPWRAEEIHIQIDSYTIKIAPDAGVLEMTADPISMKEFERRRPLFVEIDRVLARTGLKPMDFAGGGHIHIGLKSFEKDAVAYRNFVVMLFNLPSLARGGLSWDPNNAIHPSQLSAEQQQEFLRVIADFDQGRLPQTIAALTTALQTRFFAMPNRVDYLRINREEKYYSFAVNFNFTSRLVDNEWVYVPKGDIEETGTIEIRSIRPQASVEVLEAQFKYFEAMRNEALRMARRGVKIEAVKPKARILTREILNEFRSSVLGYGLRWEDYRQMVLPEWRIPGGELDQFEASLPAPIIGCSMAWSLR